MKRIVCCIMILLLLLLWGCTPSERKITDGVRFYYLRSEITEANYGQADGVITSEVRNIQEHTDDLQYLLRLYFQGPADPELSCPFPSDTKLIQAELQEQTLQIILDTSFDSYSSLEQTLAYACLTMTCLELSEATSVSINTETGVLNGETPYIMDADSLLLLDALQITSTEPTEG